MRKKNDVNIQLVEIEDSDSVGSSSNSTPSSSSTTTVPKSKHKHIQRDPEEKKQHNQSEKYRRNLIKDDLQRLRSLVPVYDEVEKLPMLTLLRRARRIIINLKAKHDTQIELKKRLLKEQTYLTRRFEQLCGRLANNSSSSGSGMIELGNTQHRLYRRTYPSSSCLRKRTPIQVLSQPEPEPESTITYIHSIPVVDVDPLSSNSFDVEWIIAEEQQFVND